MHTQPAPNFEQDGTGRAAADLIRACVHCGFCTAACPTYRILGDERDSPRGRIYLLKDLFEEGAVTAATRRHLDRCLSCRACETACPSGVQYGRLADLGRAAIEAGGGRPWGQRVARAALRNALSRPRLFAMLLTLGRAARPLLPDRWKRLVPPARAAGPWPAPRHDRVMLAPTGCVQPAVLPAIDAAAARILDTLGITLVAVDTGCCGALGHHLGATDEARDRMRRTIDSCWPHIERGA